MFSLGSCVLTLDPQLVALFWEVSEHLGDVAGSGPCRQILGFTAQSLLPDQPHGWFSHQSHKLFLPQNLPHQARLVFSLTKMNTSSLKLLYPDLYHKDEKSSRPMGEMEVKVARLTLRGVQAWSRMPVCCAGSDLNSLKPAVKPQASSPAL